MRFLFYKKNQLFFLFILCSAVLTVASVYILEYRLSNYVDGMWGHVFDRGGVDFRVISYLLATYIPVIVFSFFCLEKTIRRVALGAAIAFLGIAVFVEMSVVFSELTKESDLIYLISMVLRLSVSILCFLVFLVFKSAKLFWNRRK